MIMSNTKHPQILVTGANGQLGRLVINKLLETVPADRLTATVRNPDSVSDFAARGVNVRVADYDRRDTLQAAFAGIDRMLLVSSPNNMGARTSQQKNVIEAAVRAGVSCLVYTSILHADTSGLKLAEEHRETEALLVDADIEAVLLRNGWYAENLTSTIESTLASDARYGSARNVQPHARTTRPPCSSPTDQDRSTSWPVTTLSRSPTTPMKSLVNPDRKSTISIYPRQIRLLYFPSFSFRT